MFDKITVKKTSNIIEISNTVYNVNQIVSFKKTASAIGKNIVPKLEINTVLGQNVISFDSIKERDNIFKELKSKFNLE